MPMLLFDELREMLGEAVSTNGSLTRLQLTPQGERAIGAQCKNWLTLGIPARKEAVHLKNDGARDIIRCYERVQPREEGFQEALEAWGEECGISVVFLPDELLPLWESLMRLPLERQERFVLLSALIQTPADLLPEWRKALQSAIRRH